MSPSQPDDRSTPLSPVGETQTETIPIVQEFFTVEKRVTETGRVRVRTVVDEQPVTLRETVLQSSVNVERLPIGRVVDSIPDVREEGGVTIVPIIEEQAYMAKRLVLVEEVRITRAHNQVPVELQTTRRVMHAVIERDDVSNTPGND